MECFIGVFDITNDLVLFTLIVMDLLCVNPHVVLNSEEMVPSANFGFDTNGKTFLLTQLIYFIHFYLRE